MTTGKDTTIDGVAYHTTIFPFTDAVDIAFRLFDMLAEPLGPVADGLLSGGLEGGLKEALESDIKFADALPKLSARLLANRDLVSLLLRNTSRDGVRLSDRAALDLAYTGRLAECGQALRWVILENRFHDFFAGFVKS
jgi:hypothetical protein